MKHFKDIFKYSLALIENRLYADGDPVTKVTDPHVHYVTKAFFISTEYMGDILPRYRNSVHLGRNVKNVFTCVEDWDFLDRYEIGAKHG